MGSVLVSRCVRNRPEGVRVHNLCMYTAHMTLCEIKSYKKQTSNINGKKVHCLKIIIVVQRETEYNYYI